MRVAILGLGRMGKGLARRLAGKVELSLAARSPQDAVALAESLGAEVSVRDNKRAVADAEIVILALRYPDVFVEIESGTDFTGKVIVDITNPLKPDFSGMTIGFDSSAAEEIQKAAPGARVVKAYNTIFSPLLDLPAKETADLPVFLSSDDADAANRVAELVRLSGFAPEPIGALTTARLTEPLGMLNIHMGFALKKGMHIAPTWVELAAPA